MSAPMTRAPLTPSTQMSHVRLAPGADAVATLPVSGPMTKGDLFALFPAGHSLEVEQARGRFLSALRLRDAMLAPARLLARLQAWNTRRATAAALMDLPDAMLRDIGLSRGEILRAADAATVHPAGRAPR